MVNEWYHHFQKFGVYAENAGLQAEFTEVEGYDHEWRFWELCIQGAMENFLPGQKAGGNAF